MKKVIFGILLCIFLQNGMAFANSNWITLSDKMYLDTNSIRKEGNFGSKYSFWWKSLNDNTEVFKLGEKAFPNRKIWYVLIQGIIDCENFLSANKSFYTYDTNNNIINIRTLQNYEIEWHSIPPDSFYDFVYQNICTTDYVKYHNDR